MELPDGLASGVPTLAVAEHCRHSGACPDIFDRGGTSGALTYAGVA